jgi:hypothetical protein
MNKQEKIIIGLIICIILTWGFMLNYCVLVPTYDKLQEKYDKLSERKTIYFEKGCNCSLQLERNCNLTATCNVKGNTTICKANINLTGTLEEITP